MQAPPPDVISGGYPCQPFSTAGKRKGQDDDRHLWPAMFCLIKKHRPRWVIGENVNGHVTLGLDSVLSDLESADYTARAFVIPACAIDAPHRRDRIWIVAHPKSLNDSGGAGKFHSENGRQKWDMLSEFSSSGFAPEVLSNGSSEGFPIRHEAGDNSAPAEGKQAGDQSERVCPARIWEQWLPEPGMDRVVNGLPDRVDRVTALGNTVVPRIPEIIGHAILAAEGRG